MSETAEPLRWTAEKPVEPGYYWVRWGNGDKGMWYLDEKHSVLSDGSNFTRFAGPIPQPEEE